MHVDKRSDEITFKAATSDFWTEGANHADSVASRSDGNAAYVMQSAEGSERLYIYQTTSERFEAAEEQNDTVASRGTVVSDENLATISMGVFAASFEGEWDEDTRETTYMRNVKFSMTNGGEWTCDDATYYWPGGESKKMKFFAYTPYNVKNIEFDPETIGSPKFRYKVDSIAENHKDLLVTTTPAVGKSEQVQLTLNHALTAIKFKTGEDLMPGTITSIKLKNIYMEGEYSFATNTWIIPSNAKKQDFTVNCNKTFTNKEKVDYVVADQDVNIFGDGDGLSLFMIPQKASRAASEKDDDANTPQIEIEYKTTVIGKTNKYTIDLDINWNQGETVTYKISSSNISVDYTFDVDPSNSVFEAAGCATSDAGKATLIKSYCTVTDAITGQRKTKGVPYQIAYIGSKPSWVTSPAAGKKANSSAGTLSVNFALQSAFVNEAESAEWDELKSRNPVSNYDLSTFGGSTKRNTANCYIVNAPGTYKIPLVYGNAIKNDEDYPQSYTSTKIDHPLTRCLEQFRRHDDEPINAPWIKDNTKVDAAGNIVNLKPTSAKLVWQSALDTEQIVQVNSALSADKSYLTFTVPAANIRPGQAVVGVVDEKGDLMWSWNIWITTYELNFSTGAGYVTGNDFSLMTVNLGQSEKLYMKSHERTFTIRYTQQDSKNYVDVTYTQKPGVTIWAELFTVYQWGRKDPISYQGFKYTPDKNANFSRAQTLMLYKGATIVSGQNIRILKNKERAASIGAAIKSPLTFFKDDTGRGYCYNYDYFNQESQEGIYKNLWNINLTQNISQRIKSVYDPSPAGFMVPPTRASFVNSMTLDHINVADTIGDHTKYMNFYGNIVSFPATFASSVGLVKDVVSVTCLALTTESWVADLSTEPYTTFMENKYEPKSTLTNIAGVTDIGLACPIRAISEVELPQPLH